MRRPNAIRLLVLSVAFSCATWMSAAQQPASRDIAGPPQVTTPVGTASIIGAVTGAQGGRPVGDARVVLVGSATVPEGTNQPASSLSVNRSVVTDTQGRFSFAKLPAGHFTLSVSKNGYLAAAYGQKRPGSVGSTIVIGDGQELRTDVSLMRGGVISGTIFGTSSEPVIGAQVTAWRYQGTSGGRRYVQASGSQTDDRGMYRLPNLQPGDYLVSVSPNVTDPASASGSSDSSAIEQAIASGKVQPPAAPGLPSTVTASVPPKQAVQAVSNANRKPYLPIFYPSTASRAAAQVVHVNGDDDRQATDIVIQLVEAGSIQGSIVSPTKTGIVVRVLITSNDSATDGPQTVSADSSGNFYLSPVAPGQYTVFAQTSVPPQQTGMPVTSPPTPLATEDRLWGIATTTVQSGTPTVVGIGLRPGRSISGTVLFETQKPADPSRPRGTVAAVPPPGYPVLSPSPQAVIDSNGRFSINGLAPGRYTLHLNGEGVLKSSMVGGVDTLDIPYDFSATSDVADAVLTISDRISELAGMVTGTSGKPGMDYLVMAATPDERFWTPNSRRIVVSRTGVDGKYSFKSLPTGDYYVVVLSDLVPGTQFEPDVVRSVIAAGTRVRITDGAKITQDLRVK